MRVPRVLLTMLILTALASPAFAGNYIGGGTVVLRTEDGTLVDDGVAVCRGTSGDGVGGGCLRFPPGHDGFVEVRDNAAGPSVAYQVCIDNNGDGVCGGPITSGCFDQIFFSHDDQRRFFNPLGPLPTSFLPGCEQNGGFKGYVVLLCQGVHDVVNSTPHQHTLTQGTISLAGQGTGFGDFCTPGETLAQAKPYVVR